MKNYNSDTGTAQPLSFVRVANETECDLGLDISTSVIGVCILKRGTDELVHMDHVKLNVAKLNTMWEKAEFAAKEIEKLVSDRKISRIFVEANAKAFTPGFSSADTILTLAKFNGIISFLTRNLVKVDPIDVSVVTARSRLGIKIDRKNKSKTTKEKVREQVMAMYPTLPIKTHVAKTGKSKGLVVPDKEMEDELDAFIICRGGQVLNP